MQVISEFNIGHKKNSIHYPVKQFLVQFWRQQEKKTHRQIDWLIDWLLLQFTTARLITNYDDLLLQFTIAWLLQFSTTAITIYDRYYILRRYYNLRQNSCYTGRFATTILEQHSVAILEQCCVHSKQCPNNVATTLCCAKNRRWESSRVTSPLASIYFSKTLC